MWRCDSCGFWPNWAFRVCCFRCSQERSVGKMVDYLADATVQSWVKGTPLEGMHLASVRDGEIEAFRLFDIQNVGGMPPLVVPVTVQKDSLEALNAFAQEKIAYYMQQKGYTICDDYEFTLVKCIEKPKKGSGKTRNRVHNVTEATDADLPCVRIACLRKGDGWTNDRLVDMGGGSVQHRGITDSSGKKVTNLNKLFHSEWKVQVRKESYEAWLEK